MRRSRAHGRHFVRTPGGRVVVRFIKRRPAGPKCAECGRPLSGTRPNRPHGGYLCSRCSRESIRKEVRGWS
ncbi:MAG: hypothetical protein QXH26_03290 [Candidatus Hadarchaeales archaeon]